MNPANCECSMIRAALIDEHLMKYDLDSLLKKYLKMSKDNDIYPELAAIFGGPCHTKGPDSKLTTRSPVDLVARYANMDTIGAYKLWEGGKKAKSNAKTCTKCGGLEADSSAMW